MSVPRVRALVRGAIASMAIGMAVATASSLGFLGCSAAPRTPKAEALPPLETASLARIAQGPGARWEVIVRPKSVFDGALAAPLSRLAPADGFDRLSKRLGFDVRAVPEAIFVGYAGGTFSAAQLPAGASPADALDAFDRRTLDPSGRESVRPDVVRAWGRMPDGESAVAAGMWSTKGDVIVGEAGTRSDGETGPVRVSIALALGKLRPERSLAEQSPFGALQAWIADAPLSAIARCPLDAMLDEERRPADEAKPVVTQECDGAAIALRPAPSGALSIELRVAGRWGGDAEAAGKEVRAIVAHVIDSDLGRALGLRDGKLEVSLSATAIDARLVVDAAKLAEGARQLVEADVRDVLR